jgi:hypothetical protein
MYQNILEEGRVEEIMNERYEDEEFRLLMEELGNETLVELKEALKVEIVSLRDAMRKVIKEYRDTGIPSDPDVFHARKMKYNIRLKQKLMAKHEIHKVRSLAKFMDT